jgi:tRNA threonylcarbamoyladenosine biosynthesis protein TsaE
MLKIITNSAQETILLGRKFSKILKEKDVVILMGNLGGGKTTFIKGILRGFGAKTKVLSPSFTLIREYKRKKKFICHADLYRLRKSDIFALGLEDYFYTTRSVVLIEWGEKIENYLPRYIKVKFSFLGEKSRKIIFSLKGYDENKLAILS